MALSVLGEQPIIGHGCTRINFGHGLTRINIGHGFTRINIGHGFTRINLGHGSTQIHTEGSATILRITPIQPELPFGRPPASGAPQALRIGSRTLVVHLVRDVRARRYVLRVNQDGSLRLTLPRWGSIDAARRFARGERAWIERERARVLRRTRPSVAGGEQRRLLKAAERELPKRLRALAARHGFTVGRVTIRDQRARWGSCSPRGDVSLNWRLLLMPPAIRDYILLHELAHLKVANHSRRFWRLMSELCPDWRDARRWLREQEHELGL
jgi:hypothetical protein